MSKQTQTTSALLLYNIMPKSKRNKIGKLGMQLPAIPVGQAQWETDLALQWL